MADTTKSLGCGHQSGRPGQQQEQRPSGPKLRGLDQTNDPVCGKVSLNGGRLALCSVIYSRACLRENRLREGREAQSSEGVCEAVKAAPHHPEERKGAHGCHYPPLPALTCPPLGIVIPTRAPTNHFYCKSNTDCDCLPFYWQMSLP